MQTNTIRISDLKMQPDRLGHIAQELYDITLLANDGHTSWKVSSFLFELKEERSVYLGCFEDEKLIGYICCMTVLDEASVNNFAVLPEYQGEGVGTALLREMILLLKGEDMAKLWLEVRVSNSGAYGLYRKMGFEDIYRRKDYYQAPVEDAYILELAFPAEQES
jgi:[ribosomal protein S18]-alanine N-acetyltransferase